MTDSQSRCIKDALFTNAFESFNTPQRKFTASKKLFPNHDTATKSINLALMQTKSKCRKDRFNWAKIYN